jgi:DNA-directed RNA polymerase specialized sigma24 family protein
MAGHILVQDPNTLATRFSSNPKFGGDDCFDAESALDTMSGLESMIEESLSPEEAELALNKPNFSLIEPLLVRIPPREADLVRLYYKFDMKQEQIAKIFNITQAAVSYRLARARRRIQFLFTIPVLDKDVFESDLSELFSEQDREIMWRMYETTCQSKIAKQMGLTQGRVRHRFFRALDKIKELIEQETRPIYLKLQQLEKNGAHESDVAFARQDCEDAIDNSKYAKYYTVFFSISDKHFNILHEVSLPQFQDRGDAQVLTVD